MLPDKFWFRGTCEFFPLAGSVFKIGLEFDVIVHEYQGFKFGRPPNTGHRLDRRTTTRRDSNQPLWLIRETGPHTFLFRTSTFAFRLKGVLATLGSARITLLPSSKSTTFDIHTHIG